MMYLDLEELEAKYLRIVAILVDALPGDRRDSSAVISSVILLIPLKQAVMSANPRGNR